MALIEFGNPKGWYFGILAIISGLLFLYSAIVNSKVLKRLGDDMLVGNLFVNHSRSRQIVKKIGLVLAVLLAVFSLSMPRIGEGVRILKRQGCDICIALDLSTSMLAEDIKPNRIEMAKETIRTLVSLLPDDRFALVGFAGDAFIHCPLTPDHGAIAMFLDFLKPGVVPEQGTDIGRAIMVSLDALKTGTAGGKAIVILTDGEDHGGRVDEALKVATSQGVKIYPVGIGSEAGEPIPIKDKDGRIMAYKRDRDEKVVISRLDRGLLTKIAEATGGEALIVKGARGVVDRLAKALSEIEKTTLEQRTFARYKELFQIPLGFCLTILVLEALIPDGRRKKLA